LQLSPQGDIVLNPVWSAAECGVSALPKSAPGVFFPDTLTSQTLT